MQFIVPQFIVVENKVIGPISVRQFLILLVSSGIIFVCYKLFNFWIFSLALVLISAFAVVLAFVKINSQPFHLFMLNFVQTMKRPNLRLWRKDLVRIKEKGKVKDIKEVLLPAKELRASRLTELSLLVDTGGSYNPGLDNNNQVSKK